MSRATAAALVLGLLAGSPLAAQPAPTARVTRGTAIMERPRGDSVVLASVEAGVVLEVVSRQGPWVEVMAPRDGAGVTNAGKPWQRGWIHGSFVALSGVGTGAVRPPGELLIRGFGQAGGALFTANDSFDTILGRSFQPVFGGGVQVALSNGFFVQGSATRFRKTGSRAIVSGSQVFSIDVPATITLTPVQGTVGYRELRSRRYVPYLGAGIGWHRLEEDSPTPQGTAATDRGHVGYHVLGGAEIPLTSWLSVAGEVQWVTVPDGLGARGVAAVFEEDDLGETTFRVKILIGR